MYTVALALVMAGSLPAGQESNDLAEKAATILRKQCVQCHGSAKGATANLKILDHAQLISEDRRLVVQGKPEESELFQLVECGSMPPGTAPKVSDEDRKVLRTWIEQDAPPFPPHTGEPYILAQIQADINRLAAADRPKVRYVSLNHLLDGDGAKDLDVYRAALGKALNLFATNVNVVQLPPIDPDKTIFRIRLEELGWDKRPFVADPKYKGKEIDPTLVNLYDLILLEYPYAVPPDNSPAGKALVKSFLKPANLLRPVPYVRGDWLVVAVTDAPLYGELRGEAASVQPKKPADGDPLRFVAERFARNPGPAGVPALDALSVPDSEPGGAPTMVALEVLDPDGKPGRVFKPGQKISFKLTNDEALMVNYQLVATDVKGLKFVLRENALAPGASISIPATIGHNAGKEHLTVLVSKAPLPPAALLKTKNEDARRVVHALYKIDEDNSIQTLFDPARIVKITKSFETVDKR
jgi:mono/diheme cytochrome c family protein